ncbi:protein of unknown function [Modestobacter sp. DSM 44400]|uniref:eCIS core domain-containing protein n=1 Tax=Modestobacter sp. DSM 44400 TaxID=1550230 RepID=UPI00089AD1F4|nr:DUF4157 domain-containing protein [Modestobacter sp. DSM 44400]SDY55078.1 protein of unknown function [Modestobacter sp. DSM 44400]
MTAHQRERVPSVSAAAPTRGRPGREPARPGPNLPPVLDLQARIGNRATTRLVPVLSAAPMLPGAALVQRCGGREPCGCHDEEENATALQPRLRIGPAGDRYEQEAERMSAAVLGAPPTSDARPRPGPALVDQLQRSLDPADETGPGFDADLEPAVDVASEVDTPPDVDRVEDVEDVGEVEDEVGGDAGGDDGDDAGGDAELRSAGAGTPAGPAVERPGPVELRRHPAAPAPQSSGADVQGYVAGLGRGGHALPAGTRGELEPLFRYDLSDVRVHDDPAAARAAQAVGALAFTVGRHVVFAAGQYAPATRTGRALLAHELTHVVQQSGSRGAPPGIQRARWGPCPPGQSLPAHHPFRYTAAELTMLAYYRAVGGSSCWSSNVEKFWEMSCTGPAGRRIRQFARNFRSGKGSQNRRIGADPGKVAAPGRGEGALDAIAGGEAAMTAVAAFVQPDIIDFQHREIYDVTTAKQAGAKVAKVHGYAVLASRITGEHWTPGTRLQSRPMPPPYRFMPGETICFGPTDLAARPGVLAYEVIGSGKKKSKKKARGKKQRAKPTKKGPKKTGPKKTAPKKTASKKTASKKTASKKPDAKKPDAQTPPKTLPVGGANIGFGISIGSTGGGSANAGVGISILSRGASYGTVSAGVVYDSTGYAVGTVGVGAGAGNTGAAALSAGAGAAKDTTSAGVATAGAGTSSGSTSVAAASAGAGTSKDDTTAGVAVAGKGSSEGNLGAAAGTSGSGRSEGNVTAVAGGSGGTGGSGQIGASSAAGTAAGETSAGGTAAAGTSAPGASAEGTTAEGTRRPDGGSGAGQGAGAAGAHGLGIPGSSPADADRAVDEAAAMERLLRSASPAQRAFFTALIRKTQGGSFVVPGSQWVQLMLTATTDVSQEDLAYLITLDWHPGQVTAEQLRQQVRQALARRTSGAPPGLPADAGSGDRVAAHVKPPTAPVAGKAAPTPEAGRTGTRDAKDEPGEPGESQQERIERLAHRARDHGPSAGQDVLLYSKSAKPGQQIDATVYLHLQVPGTGAILWWTADVHGTLTGRGDASGFQVASGTELVSAGGDVLRVGWWGQLNPLRFRP